MMACGSRHGNAEVVDEFEKLVIRMNPPRVTVDNESDITATLVKVDSANKYGTLLEVVQVLTDLKLTINRAYISSDGEWFMDVFHVVDEEGNKLYDGQVIDRIEQSLGAGSLSFRATDAETETAAAAMAQATAIELVGRDRPGLLSEVFAVLTNLRCNIASSEVWTHGGRMAALVRVTDADTGAGIEEDDDPERLDTVKRLLRHVLRGRAAVQARPGGALHAHRRLHQMMSADLRSRAAAAGAGDEEEEDCEGVVVGVEECAERGYTVVNVRCRDRAKLLFDTVCTLTDMQYVVFHGTVIAEGSEAYQEFYIRHLDDGAAASASAADRARLRRCLQAAIQRRNTEGVVGLELRCEDRPGLLSDVTRVFREHGLSVTHAEVATWGTQAADVFRVVTASGDAPVPARAVDAVRAEVGEDILFIKDDTLAASANAVGGPVSPTGRGGGDGRRSLGNMIRSRSEKFLFNLGLIRSCS